MHNLTLNPSTHEVRRNGVLINLNATDFRILKLLMQKSPAVVSKQEIESEVWHVYIHPRRTIRTLYLLPAQRYRQTVYDATYQDTAPTRLVFMC